MYLSTSFAFSPQSPFAPLCGARTNKIQWPTCDIFQPTTLMLTFRELFRLMNNDKALQILRDAHIAMFSYLCGKRIVGKTGVHADLFLNYSTEWDVWLKHKIFQLDCWRQWSQFYSVCLHVISGNRTDPFNHGTFLLAFGKVWGVVVAFLFFGVLTSSSLSESSPAFPIPLVPIFKRKKKWGMLNFHMRHCCAGKAILFSWIHVWRNSNGFNNSSC